jgi:hypothetical protein
MVITTVMMQAMAMVLITPDGIDGVVFDKLKDYLPGN